MRLNAHITLFHPTDQPVDLRPARDHFEQVDDYPAIAQALSECAEPHLKAETNLSRR